MHVGDENFQPNPINWRRVCAGWAIFFLVLACLTLYWMGYNGKLTAKREQEHQHTFSKWGEPKEFIGHYQQFRTCTECGLAEAREMTPK